MKILFLSVLSIVSISLFSQKQHDWYSFGIQHMDKNMSSISPTHGDDYYSLLNYPVVKGEFFANGKLHRFDVSGIFMYLIGLKQQSTSGEGMNIQTRTDKSMDLIQDRLSWEWMSTKLSDSDGSFDHGFGWQIGMRKFGFTDMGLLKSDVKINPGYTDAGPYAFRSTLSLGMHYQVIKSFGDVAMLRAGVFANGLGGIKKYGGMVYPEVSLNLHIWRVAVIGTVAYETTYLYSPTQAPFQNEPAEKSGLIHGPRLELSFGVDIGSSK